MKFELTDEVIEYEGRTLYRIKALKSFASVREGDRGGYVQCLSNLSQEGDSWVFDEAKVYDSALISQNAIISNKAEVYGDALVSGNARVRDQAKVSGPLIITDSADICSNAYVSGRLYLSGDILIGKDAELAQEGDFISISNFAPNNTNISAYRDKTGDILIRKGVSTYHLSDIIPENYAHAKFTRETLVWNALINFLITYFNREEKQNETINKEVPKN